MMKYVPLADPKHEQPHASDNTHSASGAIPVVTVAHEDSESDQSDVSESKQAYEQQATLTCWDYLLCRVCVRQEAHAADYSNAIRSEPSHLEALQSGTSSEDLAAQLHALHVSHAASQRRLEDQMAALRAQMSEMQQVLCGHMEKVSADQVSIRHRQIAIGDMQSAQLAAEARELASLGPPRGAASTSGASSILRGLISPRQSMSRPRNFAPNR